MLFHPHHACGKAQKPKPRLKGLTALFQYPDNQLFSKSTAYHTLVLFVGPKLTSTWVKLWGQRHPPNPSPSTPDPSQRHKPMNPALLVKIMPSQNKQLWRIIMSLNTSKMGLVTLWPQRMRKIGLWLWCAWITNLSTWSNERVILQWNSDQPGY